MNLQRKNAGCVRRTTQAWIVGADHRRDAVQHSFIEFSPVDIVLAHLLDASSDRQVVVARRYNQICPSNRALRIGIRFIELQGFSYLVMSLALARHVCLRYATNLQNFQLVEDLTALEAPPDNIDDLISVAFTTRPEILALEFPNRIRSEISEGGTRPSFLRYSRPRSSGRYTSSQFRSLELVCSRRRERQHCGVQWLFVHSQISRSIAPRPGGPGTAARRAGSHRSRRQDKLAERKGRASASGRDATTPGAGQSCTQLRTFALQTRLGIDCGT